VIKANINEDNLLDALEYFPQKNETKHKKYLFKSLKSNGSRTIQISLVICEIE